MIKAQAEIDRQSCKGAFTHPVYAFVYRIAFLFYYLPLFSHFKLQENHKYMGMNGLTTINSITLLK
jgi:hypothetical protein